MSVIASSLGLSSLTLQRWLRHAPPAASVFLPITLAPVSSPPASFSEGVVRLPNGICVEGLSLAQIITLCRSLSA